MNLGFEECGASAYNPLIHGGTMDHAVIVRW